MSECWLLGWPIDGSSSVTEKKSVLKLTDSTACCSGLNGSLFVNVIFFIAVLFGYPDSLFGIPDSLFGYPNSLFGNPDPLFY